MASQKQHMVALKADTHAALQRLQFQLCAAQNKILSLDEIIKQLLAQR